MTPGVYGIRPKGKTQFVKIGQSGNMELRGRGHRAKYPRREYDFVFLAVMPGSTQREREKREAIIQKENGLYTDLESRGLTFYNRRHMNLKRTKR